MKTQVDRLIERLEGSPEEDRREAATIIRMYRSKCDSTIAEQEVLFAARAYKRARSASRDAIRKGVPPTREGQLRMKALDDAQLTTIEDLKNAAARLA